ncbi:uncharacterized protein LOC134827945 [Culicoides brevitarsis]|uniref:uncharacterized protein LOC134827945 n=1 Tax=Culicoides brevitarsis TaxID=469753 RepID=UPI00307C5511
MTSNYFNCHIQESLSNEKRRWENAINCYRGNDPLGLWWNYICWLEQNTHMDTENQFRKSLEQCLSIYENYDGYKQDVRFVKLWIKYIDMQPNPPQMYQMLYHRGVGTRIAAFYIGWAHYFDSAGAFKQAESIFNLALQTHAEPLEELREAQNKFRMSIAQRMLYDDGSSKKRSATCLAEQRQQITQLNPNGKRQRSEYDIHASKNSVTEETLQFSYKSLQDQNADEKKQNHKHTQETYDYVPPTLDNSASVIFSSLNYVYDETKTEDINQLDCNAVYDFDSGIQLPSNHMKVATNKFQMWRVPLFLDEPCELKRVHYPRNYVYPGDGTEYSLEELRSRKWYRRVEEIRDRKRILHQKQEEERVRLHQERLNSIAQQQEYKKRHQIEEKLRQEDLAIEEHQRQQYLKSQAQYIMNTNNSFSGNKSYSTKANNSFHQSDDIEDQIEASTISFSSGEHGANKRLTIKFKKERAKEIGSVLSVTPCTKEKQDQRRYTVVNNYDNSKNDEIISSGCYLNDDTTSYTLISAAYANEDEDSCNSEFNNSISGENSMQEYNYNNFCSTPIRPHFAKNSEKISSFSNTIKLKSRTSNNSFMNDDSQSSEQKCFLEVDNEETRKRRIESALITIKTHLSRSSIDPFSPELCKAFLTKLNFPNRESTSNCCIINSYFARFSKGMDISLGGSDYYVDKEVGKGAYGAVYRGIKNDTKDVVALKYQKPSNSWEFYICQEVRKRCKDTDMLPGFMHISMALIAPNCTVFVSEFSSFGSLLDINNKIRAATTKVMHESLVMHFTSQIFNIVNHLHKCKIIHADIKPDNFLLMKAPMIDSHVPTLRLIDFGCAIDMTLFEEDQQFKKVIQTDGFTCIEMLEGRDWSYQTDLFCVAGTIHVMLFGEYMQLSKNGTFWEIKNKLPRYLKKHVWSEIFNKLLNIKNVKNLPNLSELKMLVDNEVLNMESDLIHNTRMLSNLAKPVIVKRQNKKTGNKSQLTSNSSTLLNG